MNRRQLLSLSALGAGSIFLNQCARNVAQETAGLSREPAAPIAPATITRSNGLVEVAMDARSSFVDIAGQERLLYSYSGEIPGPHIEASPGDTLRIRFTNALAEPTNLHFHGLHIPPTGTGDDVFRKIASGETFTYEFKIPTDHPGGVVYYHPHYHGTVAQQILGGLGGMIVVRGAVDELPEIQAAQEEFAFLKDFSIAENWLAADAWETGLMAGREGGLLTVNGEVNPIWEMPASGLMRLRLVNASNARFYRLALEDHPFYLIGTDGHPLEAPVLLSELLLVPGERADVLVQAQPEIAPGQTFKLMNLPYRRGGMGMGGGMGMMGHNGGGASGSDSQELARLSYGLNVGSNTVTALPAALIPLASLEQPSQIRRFTLNHGMAPGQGMVFLIDGQPFDHSRIDTRVKLGTVEDWEVSNTGVMDHPFHLHVNPFQVISRNGQPEPFTAWKDTVLVKPGETLRLRVKFADFPGKTVYHCHILDHEERGMMGVIEMEA